MRLHFILYFFLGLCACNSVSENVTPNLEVVYVDIKESCGWNLKILDGSTISNFEESRRDSFLHSNIEQIHTDALLSFGDEFIIEYEVLENVPDDYPMADAQCNRWEGIPIRITKLSE